MFRNSLESLQKSTGECKNYHFNKLPKFLKIFENLRKSLVLRTSSEIFGKIQKNSETVAKCLKQHFSIFEFFKSSEIVGSLRKFSEVFGKIGKCRKILKTIFRQFLKIFENFRKSSEVFGNPRKNSEILGKFSNVFGGLRNFYNIPISDAYGLKIRSTNFDL